MLPIILEKFKFFNISPEEVCFWGKKQVFYHEVIDRITGITK